MINHFAAFAAKIFIVNFYVVGVAAFTAMLAGNYIFCDGSHNDKIKGSVAVTENEG